MIGRQAGEGAALDLAAVQRDDDLLALLGSRGEVDPRDPVARLLAALGDDVDDGLDELLAELPPPAPGPVPGQRSRRAVVGAAALAVALGASLSVSGVAAAVTGDPLAPYRAVGNALSWGEDELPRTAAPVAQLNKRLARARAAIAHGEVDGAQARLDALRARLAGMDLPDGQRAAFERKLDRLEAAVLDAGPKGVGREKPAGGPPADKGPTDRPGQSGTHQRPGKHGPGATAPAKPEKSTSSPRSRASDRPAATRQAPRTSKAPQAKKPPSQSARTAGSGAGRAKG